MDLYFLLDVLNVPSEEWEGNFQLAIRLTEIKFSRLGKAARTVCNPFSSFGPSLVWETGVKSALAVALLLMGLHSGFHYGVCNMAAEDL